MSGAIAGLATAAHAASLGYGFTGLDDSDLIVDDQAFLAQPGSPWRAFGRAYMHVVDPAHAYYRPMVAASYALDARWSGVRAFGYHATNLGLHAVAATLLLWLLRRLGMPRVVAVAGAAVFAVHPALVPAVAWIPGRNDSLLAVFALGAWLAFDARRAPHFLLFGAALLTKETAFALPAVWIAQRLLVKPGNRPRAPGRDWTVYGAGWAVLIAARLALSARGALEGPSVLALLRHGPVLLSSLGDWAFPVAPAPLAVPEDLSPWLGGLAAVFIAVATARVAGVRPGVVAFGVLAFALLLAPALAWPGTLVLESRLYLPACGLMLALAELARAAVAREGQRLFVALSAVLVVALGAVTAGYSAAFRDWLAFAREAVEGSPHSALAHFCLGQAYQLAGAPDRALAEYRTSLSLGPGEVVHNNIAVIAMHDARWADAERELREELALNPSFARAYENLAVVLRHEGRPDEARAAAETAARLSDAP